MKLNCPNCGARFDNMGLPVPEVECPDCHQTFTPTLRQQTRKRSPYRSEVEREAQSTLGKIHEMVTDCDVGVRQWVLWHLEEEWLGDAGHKVTIKLGENSYVNPAACSVCGKDTTHKGFTCHIISGWRNITTAVYLCGEHKATPYIHARDVNIHKDNICPRFSLY